MERVLIEWGNLDRAESIENDVFEKSEKILGLAQEATNLIVKFKVINPKSSAGVATQSVTMELRLPDNQDIRASKEGDNLYKSIKETEAAILSQLRSKKR